MKNPILQLPLHPNFKPHSLLVCKNGSLLNIFDGLDSNNLSYETYNNCFKTKSLVTTNVSNQSYDKDLVMNYLSRIINSDLLFFASVDSFTRVMELIEPYLMSYISLRQQYSKSCLTASFLSSHLTKTNLSSATESSQFNQNFAQNIQIFIKDFLWLTPGQITQNAIIRYFYDKGCNIDEIKQHLVGEFNSSAIKLGYQAALTNWLNTSSLIKNCEEHETSASFKLVVLGNAQSTVKYDLITQRTLKELLLDDLIKINVTNLPIYSTEFDQADFVQFLSNYLEDYECQCACVDKSNARFNPEQDHILFVSQSKIAELLLSQYPHYLRFFDYMIFLHGSSDLSSVLTNQYKQVYPPQGSCAVENLSACQASFKRFTPITNTDNSTHNTTNLPDLILPLNLDLLTLKDIIMYLNSRVQ